MAEFSIEEIYKSFRVIDRKLPFRLWTKQKRKKKKKLYAKSQKKPNHKIDIYV
jgi:hypothetical protein